MIVWNMKKKRAKILVAISGGIDSAVAALLLKKQGYEVEGLHFVLQNGKDPLWGAKRVARQLGIRLEVLDLRSEFKKKVISRFVSDYKKGITPNPCVVCNPELKFLQLLSYANQKEISRIATGHYATIIEGDRGLSLRRSFDQTKDQSYFLYRLAQNQLKKTVFPLGRLSKMEVKAIAIDNGIAVGQKESQDICFFGSDERLESFLKKHIKVRPGPIIDEQGTIIGTHKGAELLTTGQRHGLGLSGGPYYVINKSLKDNSVVVTTKPDHPLLAPKRFSLERAKWINQEPAATRKYSFKTRYLSKFTPGRISKTKGKWEVELDEAQWATTPGQSCVVYDRDKVVGGGIISKIGKD